MFIVKTCVLVLWQSDTVSAPQSARAKVREELTRQILQAAEARLATDGAAGLSLRSVARDLQMAPSALYRYFDGRDALLHTLILGAYESLADRVEEAAAEAQAAGGTDRRRWRRAPVALRQWALANPQQWALIFGTPVPGYRAPEDTVAPYARLAAALVQPVVAAASAGRLAVPHPGTEERPGLAATVAPVAEALAPGVPGAVVAAIVQCWATLVGTVSLELFGHWHNTVWDPDLFFGVVVDRLADDLGLPPD